MSGTVLLGLTAFIVAPYSASAWPPNTGCSAFYRNFGGNAECDTGLYEYRVSVSIRRCDSTKAWNIYGAWKSSPNVSYRAIPAYHCSTGIGIQYGAYG